jgi:uncharacterized membrane protein YoaK (UPF0700 family)
VAFATERYDEVRMAGALLLSFVSGVMIATVVARRWPKHAQAAVMITVTLLLGLAATITHFQPNAKALLLLAVAMGAENGLFLRDGEVSIGLTYMTGSLVRMAQRLAGALMGDADRWTWTRYLLLWLGFISGVVLGARCYGLFDTGALWLATAAAALLTVVIATMDRGKEPIGPWGVRAV